MHDYDDNGFGGSSRTSNAFEKAKRDEYAPTFPVLCSKHTFNHCWIIRLAISILAALLSCFVVSLGDKYTMRQSAVLFTPHKHVAIAELRDPSYSKSIKILDFAVEIPRNLSLDCFLRFFFVNLGREGVLRAGVNAADIIEAFEPIGCGIGKICWQRVIKWHLVSTGIYGYLMSGRLAGISECQFANNDLIGIAHEMRRIDSDVSPQLPLGGIFCTSNQAIGGIPQLYSGDRQDGIEGNQQKSIDGDGIVRQPFPKAFFALCFGVFIAAGCLTWLYMDWLGRKPYRRRE